LSTGPINSFLADLQFLSGGTSGCCCAQNEISFTADF